MKCELKTVLALGVAVAVFQPFVKAADAAAPTNQLQKVSYALGMNYGRNFKEQGVEVDPDVFAAAIKDVFAGNELKLTQQQAQETITTYGQELRAKREKERARQSAENRAKAVEFLAQNKNQPGVKTQTVTLSDTNTAELQYKVLKEGTGETPGPNDTVTFSLKGTLIGGKEFENTPNRRTVVSRTPIRGLGEALRQMKVGSKWQLFLPPALGFGDAGYATSVEPGSALIYEVELVAIEPAQPMTSDIIRVPSKEELEKGAKIEVIKPEDVKRMQATNSAAGGSK